MRRYDFIKYEGCGNDYIYIDCFGYEPSDDEKSHITKKLADRHYGVGSDGVVFICASKQADGYMRMFNADGSEGKMCGNAIRCVAKYLYERRNLVKPRLAIETLSGIKTLDLKVEDGKVIAATVDMGEPRLHPSEIPALVGGDSIIDRAIIHGFHEKVTLVSMGNPHCVVFTEGINAMDVRSIGESIEHHALFPDRINVEFAEVVGKNVISMRVWERGTGETLACGTGACATAVAAVLSGRAEKGKDIDVRLTGGVLKVNYDGKSVRMSGPATEVFTGSVEV